MGGFSVDIGGFFELELPKHKFPHMDTVLLNSARSGLRYIVRLYSIKKIYVPAFTCPVVWKALKDEGCELQFYDIGSDMLPVIFPPANEWVLYTNYYGICAKQVGEMTGRYKHLILDLAQSFFSEYSCCPCIYSPRKFFGLPDGGMVLADKKLDESFEQGVSWLRMGHLTKRIDVGPNSAYATFKENDSTLDNESIKAMSRLTYRLLEGIDYEQVRKRRIDNFNFLHERLRNGNELNLDIRNGIPLIYPYLDTKHGEHLKEKLIENRIYVATYWPGQQDRKFGSVLERYLLALPIDQRYGVDEMERILEVLNG